MATLREYLELLAADPGDASALDAVGRVAAAGGEATAAAINLARRRHLDRGDVELAFALFDLELQVTPQPAQRAALLVEKAEALYDEGYDVDGALATLDAARSIAPGDEGLDERMEEIELVRASAPRLVEKYVAEAIAQPDEELRAALLVSAAETMARAGEPAAALEPVLAQALEAAPGNLRAVRLFARLVEPQGRGADALVAWNGALATALPDSERLDALAEASRVAHALGHADAALAHARAALAIEATEPRALRVLVRVLGEHRAWPDVVAALTRAVQTVARRDPPDVEGELALLLGAAIVLWRELGDLDQAEQLFRRARELDPTRPVVREFFAARAQARGPEAVLAALLRRAEGAQGEARRDALVEAARVAETLPNQTERAAELWRQALRGAPPAVVREGRASLKRLLAATKRWNALLEVLKEELEQHPMTSPEGREGRAAVLFEMANVYDQGLGVDAQAVAALNAILALVPDHPAALDALAARYEAAGRWNDLVGVLQRKADAAKGDPPRRIAVLRRLAAIWSERFGNHAHAVKPLEELVEADPTDVEASQKLKEVYARRRQWRALLDLLGREVGALEGAAKRAHIVGMAQIASDRLGDARASMAQWNRVLELDAYDGEAMVALATLYEREKRWFALAEILGRIAAARGFAGDPAGEVTTLEKLATILLEHLKAPLLAVEAVRRILVIAPAHPRAKRALRELLAQSGDLDAAEREYVALGAIDELADLLLARADREEPAARRDVLARVIRVAEGKAPDRAFRARERLFALHPDDVANGEALFAAYRQQEKWPKLVAVGEALLKTRDGAEKTALIEELRQACEAGVGSKVMALKWAIRGYESAPTADALATVMRLGAEAEAWEELEAALHQRIDDIATPASERATLYPELARIRVRLGDRAGARVAWEGLLAIAPSNPEAQDALEELLAADGAFPELAVLLQRRAADEARPDRRIDRLQKVAFLQEERLDDLAGAARTFVEILALAPGHSRAVRALGRLATTIDDPAMLRHALELELALAQVTEEKADVLVRLGKLREERLGDRTGAFEAYAGALAAHAGSKAAILALERTLTQTTKDGASSAEAIAAARLLVPAFDRPEDAARLAACLELLRGVDADGAARLEIDRKLLPLYARRLKDPRRAYAVAARLFEAAPDDAATRAQLVELGAEAHASSDVAARLDVARGAVAGDPTKQDLRRTLAIELARLYDERLANPAAAEPAWREVLTLSEDDGGRGPAWAPIEKLLRAQGRWAELADHHDARAKRAGDQGTKREALQALADLADAELADAPRAIDAWTRLRDLLVEPAKADRALERLYEKTERWADLEALLAAGVGRAKVDQFDLAARRAELRLRRLGDPDGALELIQGGLATEPRHPGLRGLLAELMTPARPAALRVRAARLVGPLHEAEGAWVERAHDLGVERDASDDPSERLELTTRLATVQAQRLGDKAAAFATWRAAFLLEPADGRARQALPPLGLELGRGDDVAAAWEEAAEQVASTRPVLAAELYGELAWLAEERLGAPHRASAALARQLTLASASGDRRSARDAGLSLLERRGAWDELAKMLREEATREDDAALRAGLWERLARLEADRRNDARAAASAWAEVLALEPSHPTALAALDVSYETRGEWRELERILGRKLELAASAPERREILARLVRLLDERLAAPDEALEPARELASLFPDDEVALADVAGLERRLERWPELADTLARAHGLAAEPHERAKIAVELATLSFDRLGRPDEGLARLSEVLVEYPEVDRTRGGVGDGDPGLAAAGRALELVEARIKDPDLGERVDDILEPLYRAGGDAARLVGLLERKAARPGDGPERAAILLEAAGVHEARLGQLDAAFDDACAAVRLLRAEPGIAPALAIVQRLAGERDRINELFALYREIAPDVVDAELQRGIYLDLGDLARGRLGDRALAKDFYRRVLDAHPDDKRAVAALEAVHRELGEHEALAEMLLRRANAAQDLEARKAAHAERAALAEASLGNPEDATLAWEEVLEIDPSDATALAALERLHERAERWGDLATLFERKLGFVGSTEEAVAIQLRLAALRLEKMSDPEGALEAYAATLAAMPGHPGALAAVEGLLEDSAVRAEAAQVLEPIYVASHDWPKLVRVAEARLEAETDPPTRARLLRRVARLVEDQLEDLDGAFQWTTRIVREEPADRQARDQLLRLATVLERWEGLAEVCDELLRDDGVPSDAAREIAALGAEIRDRRLADVPRARAAWKRLRELDPENPVVLARLEALLTRHARWDDLIEDYDEAIDDAFDPMVKKDLLLRRARVWEERLGAHVRAVQTYETAHEIDPDDATITAQLVRLYTAHERWADLADLYQDRIGRAASPEAAVPDRLALAALEEKERHDPAAAADQLEAILEGVPGQPAALVGLERLVLDPALKERLLAVLEPEYRRVDAWQKLVVVLDEQLALAADGARRIELGREIATLHETRGGDLSIALRARSRAWFEDPRDEALLDELTQLGMRMAAWAELVATLEAGAAELDDPVWSSELLGRAAVIEETRRRAPDRAIALWRQVLTRLEDDPHALAELARLEAAAGRWAEVAPLLERRHGAAEEPAERRALLAELASVQEQKLRDPKAALGAWRRIFDDDPEDAQALGEVLRLERVAGGASTLVQALDAAIARTNDPDARAALRREAATLHEGPLDDAEEAATQQRALLGERPDDPRALVDLDRLLVKLGQWPELIELIDRRASLTPDDTTRVELQHRAARTLEVELGELDEALGRYEAILARNPAHAATRAAVEALLADDDLAPRAAAVLEPLYQAEGAADPWTRLLERRLTLPSLDDAERRATLVQLADVHERLRQDRKAAWEAWARLLAHAPDDAETLAALERLATADGRHADLARLYEDRVQAVDDDHIAGELAARAARVHEEALADLPQAAHMFRTALDRDPEPAREEELLVGMARVLERLARWKDLEAVVERQAELADAPEAQGALWARLGELRERHAASPERALTAYREALARVPTQAVARSALDRLARAGSSALRADALDLLEPVVEAEGAPGPQADLAAIRAELATDDAARAAAHRRLAELREAAGDPVAALDATQRWLLADPTSEDAADELERRAAATKRWAEVAATLIDVLGGKPGSGSDAERQLASRLTKVLLDELKDARRAEPWARRVTELEPDDAAGWVVLETVYRTLDDAPQLAEVMGRRATLELDPAARRALLIARARLFETKIGDEAGATVAWQAVLEADEGDRDAHRALAQLHARASRWEDFVALLDLAARHAPSPQAEAEMLRKIAETLADKLNDPARAAAAWERMLERAPDDLRAVDGLAAAERTRGEWDGVVRALERRQELAQDDATRVAVLVELARVHEVERRHPDDAIATWRRVVELDPQSDGAAEQLGRILVAEARWHDLTDLLNERAEIAAAAGQHDVELGALLAAADVWETQLSEPDAAAEIYDKVVSRAPGHPGALLGLARISELREDWPAAKSALEGALAAGARGADAAALEVRLAGLARRDEDAAGERAHLERAVAHDPSHGGALDALIELARTAKEPGKLVELIARRVVQLEGAARVPLLLEAGKALAEELGRPADARAPFEEAAALEGPGGVAEQALAELHLAAGRAAEARPMLERLRARAQKEHKHKLAGQLAERLGVACEALGDTAGALAAYEEAFRADPTRPATQAGLGRLYVARSDWDKALRVYRGMLLGATGTTPPTGSLSKAEVYLALGKIHAAQGERAKAKGMLEKGLEAEPAHAGLKSALSELA